MMKQTMLTLNCTMLNRHLWKQYRQRGNIEKILINNCVRTDRYHGFRLLLLWRMMRLTLSGMVMFSYIGFTTRRVVVRGWCCEVDCWQNPEAKIKLLSNQLTQWRFTFNHWVMVHQSLGVLQFYIREAIGSPLL